jgi:peptidoglycan hydrolase CwlO-like protein
LQLLRKSAQDNLAVSQMEKVEDPVTDNPESNTNFDYQALHNSYQRMEVEFQRQTILIGQLNSALEEKDSLNIKLNHQIEESGHKINRLESQIQHLQQIGSGKFK